MSFLVLFPCFIRHILFFFLVSSLTFLRVFPDSLYILYFFLFWLLSLFLFILFSPKNLSPQTLIITISSCWQSTKNTKLWGYFCLASWLDIAKYWYLLFHYNFTSLISHSKCGLQIICLRGFTYSSPREALEQYLTVHPQYATLKLNTRVCVLHFYLPVSPGAH